MARILPSHSFSSRCIVVMTGFLLSWLLSVGLPMADGFVAPSRYSFSSRKTTLLHALPSKKIIVNEFSRTVDPERIVKAAGGRRFFAMDIAATAEECAQLAKRFELPSIQTLEAVLRMRATDGSGDELLVEGTILSNVTRTCVRTSRDFDTHVEMAIQTTVRAVAPLYTEDDDDDDDDDVDQVRKWMDSHTKEPSSSSPAKRKKNKKYQSHTQTQQQRNNNNNIRSVDSMDVVELQRLLTSDLLAEEQDIMEDGSILTSGRPLDVGELVAQLFWLSLDKYPRTPGSEFTQFTISGKQV